MQEKALYCTELTSSVSDRQGLPSTVSYLFDFAPSKVKVLIRARRYALQHNTGLYSHVKWTN